MDYIQSKIELIHSVEQQTPTETTNNTAPTTEPENIGENTENGYVNVTRKLGKTALIRRGVGYTTQIIQQAIEIQNQRTLFKATLSGDPITVKKLQRNQARARDAINTIKSAGMSGLVTVTLQNPYIFALWLGNQFISNTQQMIRVSEDLARFNTLQQKEMYETTKRQARINVGVYNRRG